MRIIFLTGKILNMTLLYLDTVVLVSSNGIKFNVFAIKQIGLRNISQIIVL